MADNSTRTPGSGEEIASDDIGGVKHQRVKISVGADGAATDMAPPDGDAKPSSSILPAGLMLLGTGGTYNRVHDSSAIGDGGYSTGVNLPTSAPRLYNGSTFDRQRGNMEGTLLASAARTTTTASASQTNYNHRGVLIMCDVTVAGTSTLQLGIVGTLGGFAFILVTGALQTTTGQHSLMAYPGVLDSEYAGDARSIALPRTWDARVFKGDASSWTYSLHYAMIV